MLSYLCVTTTICWISIRTTDMYEATRYLGGIVSAYTVHTTCQLPTDIRQDSIHHLRTLAVLSRHCNIITCNSLVDITKQPHCKKKGCCANKCRFINSCGLDQSQYSHWALLMSNQNSCNTETGQRSPCTSTFVVVHPLLEQKNRVAKNEHLVHCTSLKLIKKGLQR